MKTSPRLNLTTALLIAIVIHVANMQAQTIINVDFGTQLAVDATNTWNNVTSHNSTQSNLLNTSGNTTGIAMTTSSFGGVSSSATMTAHSSMYPAFQTTNVLTDFAYVNAGSTGNIAFSGLDPTLTYNLTLTGARNDTAERFSRYVITGTAPTTTDFGTRILQTTGDNPYAGTGNAIYNNDDYVTFTGITGVSSFNLTVTANSQADFQGDNVFGYINALQLQVVPEPGALVLVGLGAVTLLARRRR